MRGDVTLELTLPSGAVRRGRPAEVMPSLLQLLDARARRAEFRDGVAGEMGQIFARRIQGVLQGGDVGRGIGGPRLSPLTESTKGHGKKLFMSGRLSAWHSLLYGGTGTVYFLFRGRAAKSEGARGEGPPLEQVAAWMEHGSEVRVTEQMRRFFRAAVFRDGWHRGFLSFREGDEIRTPARPFFGRTLDAIRGDVLQMLYARIVADWNEVR